MAVRIMKTVTSKGVLLLKFSIIKHRRLYMSIIYGETAKKSL